VAEIIAPSSALVVAERAVGTQMTINEKKVNDDQRNKTNAIRGVHLSKSSSKSRYSLTINE